MTSGDTAFSLPRKPAWDSIKMRTLRVRNSTLILLSVFFSLSAKAAEKELDFKAVKFYQIAIEPSLYGVYREGNTVWTFPGDETFTIKSSFNPSAKEKDLAFGSLHNPYEGSERFPFEGDKKKRIRGILHIGPKWAFLDSALLQFQVYNEDHKAWTPPTDLILDTAKPPRDARGEATRAEQNALRAKLTKELSREKGNPDLIAGITDIPKSWKDKDGSQYVLWLRGTSAPLLTLKCDLKEFKHCMVQRACFLKGLPEKDFPKVTSLSRDPKTDSLVLLMPGELKLLRVKGASCHRLQIEPYLRLPKSLAAAQGLFIDLENNYWVALKEADGATSASLFVWEAKSL